MSSEIRCSRGLQVSIDAFGKVQVSLHGVIILDGDSARDARKEIREMIESLMEAERMTYNLVKPRKELLMGSK